jgi:PAS domain S-box-containing protein
MPYTSRSPLTSYAAAVAITIAAFALTAWIEPLRMYTPFLSFLVAVIVSVWFGGLGPGILATALSAFASVPLVANTGDAPSVLVQRFVGFLLLAVAVNGIGEWWRRVAESERVQRGQLRVTLESIGDAVIATDARGRVTLLNAGARWLTGWTQEDAEGRQLDEIFRVVEEHSRQKVESPVSKVLRDGDIVGLADHPLLIAKNGLETPIEASGAPIRDDKRNLVGIVLAFRDIAGRRNAEQEREELLAREREARADAEEANRAKDEFLATLSHELRTPLNAMLGWARLLRAGTLDESQRSRALDVIERNTLSQAQLIEDILDVSRIVTGRLRLEVQPVDLAAAVSAAAESARPAAEAKGVHVELDLGRGGGPVLGDPERLQQVVWNLLSNAVKFTERGGIVRVSLERMDTHVEIRVVDSGAGIEPEFLPYVFDRFRQADGSTTRRHGGLGLGLAIVRHLVEMHGGSARVSSEGRGRGATFVVELPIATAPEAGTVEPVRPDIADATSPSKRLHGVSVLVVDDEPDARDIARVALEHHGAIVVTVASVADAFRAFDERLPDVIVSDVGLPVEDGYDLIRQLRERDVEHGGAIPTIALTAYARPEDRAKLLASGFQSCVVKPADPTELVSIVAGIARNRQLTTDR